MHKIITSLLLSSLFISPVFAKVIPYSPPNADKLVRNSPITNISVSDTQKPKNDYNITINYELGMHCTGFGFFLLLYSATV